MKVMKYWYDIEENIEEKMKKWQITEMILPNRNIWSQEKLLMTINDRSY